MGYFMYYTLFVYWRRQGFWNSHTSSHHHQTTLPGHLIPSIHITNDESTPETNQTSNKRNGDEKKPIGNEENRKENRRRSSTSILSSEKEMLAVLEETEEPEVSVS